MSDTPKRILFVIGDKGGVGKSFTARALAQYYLDQEIPFCGYDTNLASPNFKQFYPQTTVTISPQSLDRLSEDLSKYSVLLVDCAARAIPEIASWFHQVQPVQESLKLSVTFIFVITPDKGCAFFIRNTLPQFGCNANYVVIKNLARGEDFSIYENSESRQQFLNEFGGKEIEMVPLHESTVVQLDEHDIAFGDATYHAELTICDRARVFGFLDQMYLNLETLRPWLVAEEVA